MTNSVTKGSSVTRGLIQPPLPFYAYSKKEVDHVRASQNHQSRQTLSRERRQADELSHLQRSFKVLRSKFYRYSFNNCFLIQVQCPEATYVAGYRKWQELGRQVKKGEKAISILAPIIKKVKEDGKEEKRLVGFRSASVFDVAQTKPIDPEQDNELPELPKPERLTEDSEAIRTTITKLETHATEQGFPVQRKAIAGSALGKFSLTSKTITLRDDLEPLQEL